MSHSTNQSSDPRVIFFSQQSTPKFTILLNPVHPNIGIHVPHAVFSALPLMLTRRTRLKIKAYLVGDHFLYSRHLSV